MRVTFERTGGFAGPAMRKACTVDSAAVQAGQAEELQRLIQAANFFHLQPDSPASAPARDQFRYRISVESEGQQHTAAYPESAVPDSLRPLIAWLLQHCAAGTAG